MEYVPSLYPALTGYVQVRIPGGTVQKRKRAEEGLLALATAAAELFAPAIVKAVQIVVDAKLAQARTAAVGNGVPHKNGVARNGVLPVAQERVLFEMQRWNRGRGGSIYHLPKQVVAHAQSRLANSLQRNGMIALRNAEHFALTDKGRAYKK
jgi:uncharacterized protein YfaA (DUF2138 family)